MVFLLLVAVLFSRITYHPYIGGRAGIKMASASIPSANQPPNDLIIVHTLQLNPMIKTQISGGMLSNRISDVVTASDTLRKPV